jgi:hypothetical protein
VWLEPSDSLSHAVDVLGDSPSGAVPVLEGGSLCGLVSDREVARGVLMGPAATVGDVMTRAVPIVPSEMPIQDGLALLAETDFPALPVATPEGRFLGTIGRGELLRSIYLRRRPKQIGGMATPLGVYLSDGTFRGGASDIALVLTGVFLFIGTVVSMGLSGLAAWAWVRLGLPRVYTQWVSTAAWTLAFALWFRLSWVAGYHAAEHQTVHAIERNEALTLERVAQMPRPHPRCGTNLVVLASVFVTMYAWMGVDPLVAGIISLIIYRFLGHWVQLHITTKPATRRQLESGIRAGEQLLERYQGGAPPARFGVFHRIWNMGLVQVAIGNIGPTLLLPLLAPYVPFVERLLRYLQ